MWVSFRFVPDDILFSLSASIKKIIVVILKMVWRYILARCVLPNQFIAYDFTIVRSSLFFLHWPAHLWWIRGLFSCFPAAPSQDVFVKGSFLSTQTWNVVSWHCSNMWWFYFSSLLKPPGCASYAARVTNSVAAYMSN